MKKTTFFLAIFCLGMFMVVNGQNPLNGFSEIMDALKLGKEVKTVIHYSGCQLISDNEIEEKSPDAIGGMTIETWEYFAENSVRNKLAFLVTSTSHLIQNPKGDGYVMNYVKLKITADNKVKITARYIDAKTFEVLMDENFFGEICDGKNEASVFFYELK